MRKLLIAVTLVAGCASGPSQRKVAKAWPTRSAAPRDTIEKERTGETKARPPSSLPQTIPSVGPLRDIPPTPPLR